MTIFCFYEAFLRENVTQPMLTVKLIPRPKLRGELTVEAAKLVDLSAVVDLY
jgi:hypothetical protein